MEKRQLVIVGSSVFPRCEIKRKCTAQRIRSHRPVRRKYLLSVMCLVLILNQQRLFSMMGFGAVLLMIKSEFEQAVFMESSHDSGDRG